MFFTLTYFPTLHWKEYICVYACVYVWTYNGHNVCVHVYTYILKKSLQETPNSVLEAAKVENKMIAQSLRR